MTRALVSGLSSITLLFAVACGGAAVPHEKMAGAEAEMRAAEVGGARAPRSADCCAMRPAPGWTSCRE